jgi:hypothetical protein
MAQDLLLLSARDWLRENLNVAGIGPESIEVMFDGRPSPACGDWFVALHEGEWRVDETIGQADLSLPETFGAFVTVTRKVGVAPFDRIGTDILARQWRGLIAVCRKLIVQPSGLHMNYAHMNAWNALIGPTGVDASDVNYHPLVFQGAAATQPQGSAWFGARGQKTNPPCGLSKTLSFAKAQRCQKIEIAT